MIKYVLSLFFTSTKRIKGMQERSCGLKRICYVKKDRVMTRASFNAVALESRNEMSCQDKTEENSLQRTSTWTVAVSEVPNSF
jgi:hypothetical protein